MEKGTFARYGNKTYKVSDIKEDIIRLVSNDDVDKKHGFIEKNYPTYYKNTKLPKVYIKEIDRREIEEIYEIDYKAKFDGSEFNLSFNKSKTEFRIGTPDAELAKEKGFERTDKYYYEKIVNPDEITIIEIKKDVLS